MDFIERKALKECGWFTHVLHEPVSYHTDGLRENFDHPDLQIVLPIIPPHLAHVIFYLLVEKIKSGVHFEQDREYDDIFPYPVMFAPFMESGREVLRVLIPDPEDLLPYDPDADPRWKNSLNSLRPLRI